MSKKEDLVIINNEKVFADSSGFHCDNLDLKVVPEELNKHFNVQYIVRKSKKKGGQKINLTNIKIASNIFSFIKFIHKNLKTKSKYLIISITPYTFLACIFLFIFKKKVFLYLWSDGHEEWEHILGKWSVWIFHLMYLICMSKSEIIVCNERLSKKKAHLISISRLDESWFKNQREASSDKIKFLYVGRMSPEKGIFDFIKLFQKLNVDSSLSIVGDHKNYSPSNDKIKLLGYISKPIDLMEAYDNHSITILPSYTEGYPYVIDESLSRKRPVIIFEEISYIINNKKGIFVSKRDQKSFEETVNYVVQNYEKIQKDIGENKLPTKDSMIRQISNIISN
tara:strand:- start:4634 stop:5647 length:1014 start_codon:yes stop_codon:yes gene_type:complete